MTCFARTILVLTLTLLVSGCNQKPENISLLEGYWEIEKAETPQGEVRTYQINTAIDHYQLQSDTTGFKTRVVPKFDGSFTTSGDRETFTVLRDGKALKLYFSTPLHEHTESVILLKDQQLILTNEAGIKYTYKRFEKMDLK